MAHEYSADWEVVSPLDAPLSRRSLLKRAAVLGVGAPLAGGLLAACGGGAAEEQPTDGDTPTSPPSGATTPTGASSSGATGEGEPRRGGRLRVALIAQPPSLDIHQTTGRGVLMAMSHVYETLFTWDREYAVMPLLAATYEASDDSLTHTITLRQGVLFHNGQELTASDVIATLERWGRLSPLGELLMGATEELEEVDKYTIRFRLSRPMGIVPQLLARGGQGAYIYPKSVVDAAGDDFISEYIGTGPYRFVEFRPDRYFLLERFDDYVGPTGEPSGYAGSKAAYIDELEFIPVTDDAARVAGLQAGDYHYLEEIVADEIEMLRNDPNVVVEILPVRSYGFIGLNHAQGPMSNLTIRRAVQAALSIREHGLASHGEGFFELGPGIMLPITVWDSDAGAELYNQGNPEKARQLLQEAGYDGTPIRWLTTQDDLGDYNSAVVCKQQLEEAGFVVELIVLDEATLFTTRSQPEGWDVWNGAFILRTDPTQLPFLASCDYSGWWCSPEKEAAFERLLTETDFEARYAAFEELQRLFYEEVGAIKQQNNYGIMAKSAKLKNFGPDTTLFQLEPEFVNAWLEE